MALKQIVADLTAKALETNPTVDALGQVAGTEAVVHTVYEGLGYTMDQLKKIHTDDGIANAVFANVTGHLSKQAFLDNPELQRVSAQYPAGHNEFNTAFDRTRQSRDPSTGTVSTIMGASSMNFVVGAGRNLGELKKVKAHWRSEITAALSEAK